MRKIIIAGLTLVLLLSGCGKKELTYYPDTTAPMLENIFPDVSYEYNEEKEEGSYSPYYYNESDFSDVNAAAEKYAELIKKNGYKFLISVNFRTKEGEKLSKNLYNKNNSNAVAVYYEPPYLVISVMK